MRGEGENYAPGAHMRSFIKPSKVRCCIRRAASVVRPFHFLEQAVADRDCVDTLENVGHGVRAILQHAIVSATGCKVVWRMSISVISS